MSMLKMWFYLLPWMLFVFYFLANFAQKYTLKSLCTSVSVSSGTHQNLKGNICLSLLISKIDFMCSYDHWASTQGFNISGCLSVKTNFQLILYLNALLLVDVVIIALNIVYQMKMSKISYLWT